MQYLCVRQQTLQPPLCRILIFLYLKHYDSSARTYQSQIHGIDFLH